MTPALQTAQQLHGHGVACIPVQRSTDPHKDKKPLISWKDYQSRLPRPEETARWFSRDAAIALVAGRVQCLDFDEKHARGIFPRFGKRAEDTGLDMLLGELLLQKTPSGGFHFVWRCDGPTIPNLKLASRPATDLEKQADPHVTEFSMIETRGAGGYFLIAPSPGYELLRGDWSSIPTITEDDREALLNLARTFDERPPIEAHEPRQPTTGPTAGEATPGDDFDFRADMPALLIKHGWKPAGRDGKYWTRPGKSKGISASWDVVPGRFFVFSSSTQFEPNHVYRPWHVYAALECGGDYARAAGDLRRQGFGGVAPAKHQPAQPLPEDWNPPMESGPEAQSEPTGEALTKETEEDKIRRLLAARRWDPSATPPDVRVRFSLMGVVIGTPGNLGTINAQAKVGKSAFTGALVSSTFSDSDEIDTLGVKGLNSTGGAVVYFDTEQSKDDFWRSMTRSKRRARVDAVPSWFMSHAVGDLSASLQRRALAIKLADAKAECGSVHSVFVDGVADMVLDVNDAEECNGLVAELFQLATKYDCTIWCVIHKNPGSDKTRGHLGSQLERKAETNLTMEKEDESTVVFSLKQRGAPIFKNDGLRFAWSDEAGMHVSVAGSGRTKITPTMEKWTLHAKTVLGKKSPMQFVELRAALMADAGAAISTVEKQITNLRKSGVLIYASTGDYTFNDLQK